MFSLSGMYDFMYINKLVEIIFINCGWHSVSAFYNRWDKKGQCLFNHLKNVEGTIFWDPRTTYLAQLSGVLQIICPLSSGVTNPSATKTRSSGIMSHQAMPTGAVDVYSTALANWVIWEKWMNSFHKNILHNWSE